MSVHHLSLLEQLALAQKLRDALFWKDSESEKGMIPICVADEDTVIAVILELDDTISFDRC